LLHHTERRHAEGLACLNLSRPTAKAPSRRHGRLLLDVCCSRCTWLSRCSLLAMAGVPNMFGYSNVRSISNNEAIARDLGSPPRPPTTWRLLLALYLAVSLFAPRHGWRSQHVRLLQRSFDLEQRSHRSRPWCVSYISRPSAATAPPPPLAHEAPPPCGARRSTGQAVVGAFYLTHLYCEKKRQKAEAVRSGERASARAWV